MKYKPAAFASIILLALCGNAPTSQPGSVIYENNFSAGLDDFAIDLEQGGVVEAKAGVLTMDVPAGATVWLKRKLDGPIVIEYDATVISAGGPNDRVSDLNCFWMATDPASPDDISKNRRNGKFSDYDTLRTYYVGHGGNENTTTRFRRYVGKTGNRPLLPEHDLSVAKFLLTPNLSRHIKLVACRAEIEYLVDNERIFHHTDDNPYTSGWFAWRTVKSHIEIRNLRITQR